VDQQQPRRTILIALILSAAFAAGLILFAQRRGAWGFGPQQTILAALIAGLAVVVVVMVLVIRAARRNQPQRAEKPEQIALRLGLSYEKKADKGFHLAFGPLPGIPRSGSVQHIFTGTLDGRSVTAFQHFYMITTGQATIPIYHVVCITEAPPWPPVKVAPRNAIGRLLYRAGVRRGLLLEDEKFNAAMKVKAADEDFALLLLGPEMQQFIPAHRPITWQINPGYLALISGGQMKFDLLEQRLEILRAFWRLIPEELEAW
jgi:hypothetical protein